MTRHEFRALMLALQALLETNNVEKATEVIESIIEETSSPPSSGKDSKKK